MKQDGMILIQVLLGITLLMFISSAAFEMLHLSIKQTQVYRQQTTVFVAAEQTLTTAINNVAQLNEESNVCNSVLCIYPLQPTRNFFDLSMWQQTASNIGNAELQQYVLIEALERDLQPNKSVIAYFQITVMSYNTQNQARRILQAVVSKMFDANGKAVDNKAPVQSWRLLS